MATPFSPSDVEGPLEPRWWGGSLGSSRQVQNFGPPLTRALGPQIPCSIIHRSASMAAAQPVPAAVMAWR